MRQKISNATIFFALSLLVVMAPVANADLPSHSLEVGDSFLHDFSFSYQDSVNGTDFGNQTVAPDVLKILNQKQVKTVVHSIVPKTSYYQVNFTHEKDDLRVQGSSGIDDWRGIYIGGIFMVFFITFGIPDAGDFDDGFSSSNEVTESFAPLFASNDENTYLEIIQQINEDKEAFENSTSTPPAGAELVNSEISIDSNIDTANRIFKMNLNINYNDKSNDTTVDWTRSVEFLFDLEIDYNQSIVRNMLYEAKIEIGYEDASRLFFQSLSIGTSSNDGGFLDNIREQVSLTPAILFVLPSMIFIITIRKAKRK